MALQTGSKENINRQNKQMEEEVDRLLRQKVENSFHKVLSISAQYGVNLRKAVYMTAIKRLAEAARMRGWVSY